MNLDRRMAGPTEWDAVTYHRVSHPQLEWGRAILGRLPLDGNERVMDAGCGSGRLTAELVDRLPEGQVIAVDRSASMLLEASRHLRACGRVTCVRADLLTLPLVGTFDLIFSAATFHWVLDHDALFASLFRALRPGGRLVAQCGGARNIARVLARVSRMAAMPPYGPYFAGWRKPVLFADDSTTAARLRAVGFVDVETSLVPVTATLSDEREYRDFLAAVVLRLHLERLPDETLRERLLLTLVEMAAGDDPPFSLDYWRLNLSGRREE